jgi:hypothetical protein
MKNGQKFTLAAGLFSVIAGCGSRPESVEVSRQPSALAFTLSLSTPSGVAVDQAFLSGSNSLTVDDRVTLAQSGQLPAISGLGTGGVQLGSRVVAHSNVFSAGTTVLRSNMHVFGFVDSVGAIDRQNPIQIDHGTTTASVTPLVTSFTVTFPASKSGDQFIGPDGPVVPVAPGYYSSLNLRSRGKVLLSAGNYYFDSFSLEPQAQFQVDSSHGATFIFVRDSFSYKSPITSSSITPPSVVVGYLGSSLAYLQAGFPGVFMAPNATVELHRPDIGSYVGAFFAKDLHVFSDSTVGFSPFGSPLVCALGDKAHCDEDPTPDTDQDGPDDLIDGCPLDPNKIMARTARRTARRRIVRTALRPSRWSKTAWTTARWRATRAATHTARVSRAYLPRERVRGSRQTSNSTAIWCQAQSLPTYPAVLRHPLVRAAPPAAGSTIAPRSMAISSPLPAAAMPTAAACAATSVIAIASTPTRRATATTRTRTANASAPALVDLPAGNRSRGAQSALRMI